MEKICNANSGDDARPWLCNVCSRKFTTESAWEQHYRDSHRKGMDELHSHKCQLCNRTYGDIHALIQHKEASHGIVGILDQDILKFLNGANRLLSAKDITRGVRDELGFAVLRKRDVNPILYKLEESGKLRRFNKGSTPLWMSHDNKNVLNVE